MQPNTIIALASVLVAILALVNNIRSARERSVKSMLGESEARTTANYTQLKADIDVRLSQHSAHFAELNNRILQLRLELTQHQGRAVTRQDIDSILEDRLDPVLLHMQKSETFMEEILRAGILNPRRPTR